MRLEELLSNYIEHKGISNYALFMRSTNDHWPILVGKDNTWYSPLKTGWILRIRGSWLTQNQCGYQVIEMMVHMFSETITIYSKNYQRPNLGIFICQRGSGKYFRDKEKSYENLFNKVRPKDKNHKEEPYWKRFTKKSREWWR